MQHHRTVSGFRKVGGKSLFFSHVEKIEPEQKDTKPTIIDFVPNKPEYMQDEDKKEFLKEVAATESAGCGCF